MSPARITLAAVLSHKPILNPPPTKHDYDLLSSHGFANVPLLFGNSPRSDLSRAVIGESGKPVAMADPLTRICWAD